MYRIYIWWIRKIRLGILLTYMGVYTQTHGFTVLLNRKHLSTVYHTAIRHYFVGLMLVNACLSNVWFWVKALHYSLLFQMTILSQKLTSIRLYTTATSTDKRWTVCRGNSLPLVHFRSASPHPYRVCWTNFQIWKWMVAAVVHALRFN